jgi:hypothetical protein
MNSYEFEIAAKNAVIELCKTNFGETYDILGIELVHLSTIGKNKKCGLMDKGSRKRIYIATLEDGELTVEIYEKQKIQKVENPDTDSHWDSLLLSMDD